MKVKLFEYDFLNNVGAMSPDICVVKYYFVRVFINFKKLLSMLNALYVFQLIFCSD